MTRGMTILVAGLVLAAAGVLAAAIEPPPRTYVEDRAGVLSPETRNQLIGVLQELEQKTGARVIVLIVDTTGGEPIEQYSMARAERWKFGANQQGASVLILVAVKDRRYRFEVGYNWEDILPDSYVATVGREYFVPNFKAGNLDRGIREGTLAAARHIAQAKGVTLTGMPALGQADPRQALEPRLPPAPRGGGCCCCCGLPILLILLLALARRRRGGLFWGLLGGWLLSRSMNRGRGFGRGGGGFGDGGFGSFGGGGGGGFGGGGASGRW